MWLISNWFLQQYIFLEEKQIDFEMLEEKLELSA